MTYLRFLAFCFAISIFAASVSMAQEQGGVAPELNMPVDCEVGWNCWIANYVDHDRSKKTKDYSCGAQSYDRHKGTDFMIRNYRDMIGGVIVRAAADGEIVGTRDGMRDVDYRKLPKEALKKKECGNGVRVKHGEGWYTMYCHLRKNSVKVKKGDKVSAGDTLGMVGSSGLSMFPHLHFEVQYKSDPKEKRSYAIVDPFVGISRDDKCEAGDRALWADHVLEDLQYRGVDIFDAGFASAKPKYSALVEGLYDDETLSVRSPNLFLWARFLHVKKGDKVTFQVKGPDGDEVLNYSSEIDKTQAYRILHVGVRRPSLNWDPGFYHGYIQLIREGETGPQVFRTEATISLR